MKLRHASAADVPVIAALWNAQLGTEFPLAERVLALTLFEDPTYRAGDAVLVVEGDDVLGCGWLKRWREPYAEPRFAKTGFIGGLAVRPDQQRHGVATALLSPLEERLRGEHCEHVEISGGLLHLLPGVPEDAVAGRAFFEARGYAFGAEAQYDLHGDPATHGEVAEGVRRARSADEVLTFLAREFAGGWQLHARWHLSNGGRASDFVVLEHDGAVEGFCQIFGRNAWPPGPSTFWTPEHGGLGPIGVSERLRGRGLGHKLMRGSLHELAVSGVRSCVIDWTRLVHFYGEFGFQPFRSYWRAAKTL